LLGYGSDDPRVAQVSHDIRAGVLARRPELDVHVAFVAGGTPTGSQVAARLARHGVKEAVVVPLLLSDAFGAHAEFPALVAQIDAATSGVKVAASRPVGPETQLLSVVDRRLRDSLRARRVAELDALVFAALGSSDIRSNAIVTRRARQWATHHRLPCLTAFGAGSGPTAAEAVRTLRGQGRRHVAVGSWFLSPTSTFVREATAALNAGAVAVSDPLGAGPEIAEVVLNRYVVAAMELVNVELAEIGEPEPVPHRHLRVVSA
ncbi:MAG: hypothetical protein L0H24_14235, partial [Microlunatus sp.]|nr:hypothetical protein [Microlunatus sp.]